MDAPRAADPACLHSLGGATMGTTWSLRVLNPRLVPLPAVRAAVQGALDEVVAQMSHWAPDSLISRFNRAPAGVRFALPDAFARVLEAALHWAEASGGAFDPTVAPLVGLWGFGPQAEDSSSGPPASARLAQQRLHVGWRRLLWDPRRRELEQPGGLQLDFSGIAKGFAVDLAAEALHAQGFTDFLLEVGGELRAAGRRPGGQPWRVRIDAGTAEGEQAPPLALHDQAAATSGERWHQREASSRRWSHTLDPRTGQPAAHALAAVTVLHPQCMAADALATVLAVLGPEAGRRFADRQGVAALFALRGPQGGLQWHPSAAWPPAALQQQ